MFVAGSAVFVASLAMFVANGAPDRVVGTAPLTGFTRHVLGLPT